MSLAISPKAIGPYVIDRRLATGGMAELFVAERQGPHGFSKRVALKRILPQHVSDPDFKAMFIATLVVVPLILLIRPAPRHDGDDTLAHAAMD